MTPSTRTVALPLAANSFVEVVDVLMEQHDEIRRQCAGVERSRGAERERRFTELSRLIHRHEGGERAFVHPVVREMNATGDVIGAARLLEEGAIQRSLAELHDLGSGHACFAPLFDGLHRAIVEHATREERDEFPLLRLGVPVARLRWMADELLAASSDRLTGSQKDPRPSGTGEIR